VCYTGMYRASPPSTILSCGHSDMNLGSIIIPHSRLHIMPGDVQRPHWMSYGPPWAHYLDGYQDRLLGGPLGLPGLRYTAHDGVEHKDYGGEVLC
jgi:hypothetical protein